MSSSTGILIYLSVIFLVIGIALFLSNKPQRVYQGKMITTSRSSSGGGTGASNVPITELTEQDYVNFILKSLNQGSSSLPVTISVNSSTSITIQSEDLTSTKGFFVFSLYIDEELTKPYIFTGSIALTYNTPPIEEEKLRGGGYTWTINPPLLDLTQYWIYIEDVSYDPRDKISLTTLTFVTPRFSPIVTDEDPSMSEYMNEKFREAVEKIGLLLAEGAFGFALGEILYDDPGLYRFFKDKIENIKKLSKNNPKIKIRLQNFLKKASFKFNLFVDEVFKRLTLEQIGKLGSYLPMLFKRVSVNLNYATLEAAVDAAFATGRALYRGGVQNIKALGYAIANFWTASLRNTGSLIRGAVVATLTNPVDLVLLAISIAGVIMDEQNTGGMQDWRNYKTSDFLAYKEYMLDDHIQQLRDATYSFIPVILGPFFKYSNEELLFKTSNLNLDLLFLPSLPTSDQQISPFIRTINTSQLRIIRTLSRTGFLSELADYTYIENLQVIKDLRGIQEIFAITFRELSGKNYDATQMGTFLAYRIADIFFDDSIFSEGITKIAIYILCKLDKGNPLADGQCSYGTPSDCFNSYPWPLTSRQVYESGFSEISPVSTCPASESPCLSNINDIYDYYYGEWRDIAGLERDFGKYNVGNTNPAWTDENVIEKGGACVMFPENMRILCEATTKFDEVPSRATGGVEPRVLATNNYNKYTGECTNTKAFCDAYGVSYRSDMPIKDMAYRGSGPLPSCYESDGQRAGAILLGGESIIQYLNKFGQIVRKGCNSFFGYNSKIEAEEQSAQDALDAAVATARSDQAQIDVINKFYANRYTDSKTVQIVDLKVDRYGSMYVLYAYGTRNGTLLLVKFDKFFNPVINSDNKWILHDSGGNLNPFNMWNFTGPVQNYISSQLALGSEGDDSIYILKNTFTTDGRREQKIIKRYLDTGEEISQWNNITPESLVTQGHILYNYRDYQFVESNFNGIFIKDNNLYVAYTATFLDGTAQRPISNLLKYSGINTNSQIESYVINKFDYLPRYADWRLGKEIQSFVVDYEDYHYSFFLNFGHLTNSGSTLPLLMCYSPNTGYEYSIYLANIAIRSKFYEQPLNHYPSMFINNDSTLLYITNGIAVVAIILREIKELLPTGSGGNVTLPSSAYISMFFIENYNFNTLKNSLDTNQINPWECAVMTMDENDDICMFIERTKYVNLGNFFKTTMIFNQTKLQVPFNLVKSVTINGPVVLGVDYIEFQDLEFNENCIGHESITLSITPAPYKDEMTPMALIDVVNVSRLAGPLKLPLLANQVIFAPDVDYRISVLIDGETVWTASYIRVNNSIVTISQPPNVVYAAANLIIFDGPVEASGCRALYLGGNFRMGGKWARNEPLKESLTYYQEADIDLPGGYRIDLETGIGDSKGIPRNQSYTLTWSLPVPWNTRPGGTVSIPFSGNRASTSHIPYVCYGTTECGEYGDGYYCTGTNEEEWHVGRCEPGF